MSRLPRICVPVFCAGLVFIFPASSQAGQTVPAGAPPAATSGAPGAQRAPQAAKNLKVLPADTNLQKVMHQYTVDLGVTCDFCHAPADPVTHRSDRASDANPTKDTARYMIQMTQDLNNQYLDQMPGRRYGDPITCGTCHRGEGHPSVFPPAAAAPPAGI